MTTDPTSKREAFRIHLTNANQRNVSLDEVRQMITYLGGIAEGNDFVFPTAQLRAEVIQVLSERFGSKFATNVSAPLD